MMKTHTHNKTTKLRKFLLMKHNRNIPKFSTQTKVYFIRREIKKVLQQQVFDFYTNETETAIKLEEIYSLTTKRKFN